MKTFTLKSDNWFQCNYSIFSGFEKIGRFVSNQWKSEYTISIRETEYIIKTPNIWKEVKLIYSGNHLIGSIKNFPFKNFSVISMEGQGDYILRNNSWKGIFTLEKMGINVGQYICKIRESSVTVDEDIDESVIAAMIEQVYSYNMTITFIAVFIPLFVVIAT